MTSPRILFHLLISLAAVVSTPQTAFATDYTDSVVEWRATRIPEFNEARRIVNRAVTLGGDFVRTQDVRVKARSIELYRSAIPFYQAALAQDPSNSLIIICLATTYACAGETHQELFLLDRSAKKLPQDDEILLAYGIALVKNGRLRDALAVQYILDQRNTEKSMALRGYIRIKFGV